MLEVWSKKAGKVWAVMIYLQYILCVCCNRKHRLYNQKVCLKVKKFSELILSWTILMTKTNSRVEHCHSQSTASFLWVPTDYVVALDLTTVHPHAQLDQPTHSKNAASHGHVGKWGACLLSASSARHLQVHTTGRREHGTSGSLTGLLHWINRVQNGRRQTSQDRVTIP